MSAPAPPLLKYLQGYPDNVQQQVASALQSGRLGQRLLQTYAGASHGVRTDRALYDYVQALRTEFVRGGEPLASVRYDNKLQVVAHALGTHSTISRVQGSKLKAKREIRIASLFKDIPAPFLKMISVHELAHLREKQHNKAFYQLCTYMQSNYHLLEFDLRLLLTHHELLGPLDWRGPPHPAPAQGPPAQPGADTQTAALPLPGATTRWT